jgi:hypothetical protein
MPLWDVQVLLGHVWASTTVGYLATAKGESGVFPASGSPAEHGGVIH